jgi:capsular polysaccharide biosynthesis protein
MSKPLRWAVRLYPKAWRDRYGDEFEALLEDANPCWRDLPDILKGAFEMQMMSWTFAKVAGAFALLGLAVAAVIAIRTPNTYVSTAVLQLTPPANTDAADILARAEQDALSRKSISTIIVDSNTYQRERQTEPLEDIVQQMRNRDVRIRLLESPNGSTSNLFSIEFRNPDRAKAQRVTSELVKRFSQAIPDPEMLHLIELASSPSKQSPNHTVIVAAGVAIGLLAGALAFGIGRWPKIAAMGLAGAVVGLVVAYAIPNRYVSTAVVRLPDAAAAQDLEQKTLADSAWLQSVIQDLQLSTDAERMRRDFRVRVLPPHRVQKTAVTISFEYTGDRRKAQEVVATTVARWMQLTGGPASPVEVLDPASYPAQAVAPNRQVVVFFGLFAGVILGSIWRIRNRFRPPALTHA